MVMAKTRSVFEAPLHGVTVAKGVAEDAARHFGDRLVRVLLYGSWARGEGGIDSDVDILVVLTEVRAEDNGLRSRMSELRGDWFERGGRAVSIRAVSETELAEAQTARRPTARQMFLRTAMSESKTILDVAA